MPGAQQEAKHGIVSSYKVMPFAINTKMKKILHGTSVELLLHIFILKIFSE
jgi:hypothetical protein